MSRTTVTGAWLCFTLLLSHALRPLPAQQPAPESEARRTPRSTVLAVIGAIAGAAAGTFFHKQAGGDACRACYLAAGSIAGGVAGILVGRELDQMDALRSRGVPRIRVPFLEHPLGSHPLTLAARDTLLAVATSSGVSILSSTDILRPRHQRARGIRNIAALDLAPRSLALAVATPSGLFIYPAGDGPGRLVRAGTIQAASVAEDRVIYAIGERIEWAPLDERSDSAQAGIDLPAAASHLRWESERSLLWVVSDTLLIAMRIGGDSGRIVSRTRVSAGGRSLATSGDRVVIALGGDGVAIIDTSDPVAPYEAARWTGARFVYDAAIAGNRMYAGGGPDGVYIVDISVIPPRTIGLAFDLGFAASLLSRDGFTYILDRRTASVRRISTPTTR